jgi:signal transduction histidine kinase/ligand-binding sensor domain-containing protein/DNA-binding response OmpR family regulator
MLASNNMKNRLVLFIFLIIMVLPARADLVVQSTKITTKDGLPSSSILYMMQDSKGFIWMGTLNGLTRYDGISFTTYHPQKGNGVSIADRRIYDINEDCHNYLWISTKSDMFSCFNLRTGQFVKIAGLDNNHYGRYFHAKDGSVWLWRGNYGACRISYNKDNFKSVMYKKNNRRLPSNNSTFIGQGCDGVIWLGTDKGLARVTPNGSSTIVNSTDNFSNMANFGSVSYFATTSGKVFFYSYGLKQCAALPFMPDERLTGQFTVGSDWYLMTTRGVFRFDFVTRQAVYDKQLFGRNIADGQTQTDNKGNAWIYNHTGNLWLVDRFTGKIQMLNVIPPKRMEYIDFERYHIVQDRNGYFWISTYGNGLFVYDPLTKRTQHYVAGTDNNTPLGSDFLQYVMEDRSGDIWVSQEFLGVSRITVLDQNNLRLFLTSPSAFDRSNTIRMISTSINGDVWVASRLGGLFVYDKQMHLKSKNVNERANIYAMKEDSHGVKWIGTRGDGLQIGNDRYTNNASDPMSIPNNNIFCIMRDNKNRMWIGTYGGGLVLAEKHENKYVFRRFFSSDTNASEQNVRVLMQDNNGMFWMGTSYGIYVFNPDRLIRNPKAYYCYNIANNSLSSDEIRCITQDHSGRIWIGNSGTGFSCCSRPVKGHYGKLHFTNYSTKDGLVNDVVLSIIEDRTGHLWMSTENGISKFTPATHQFENYLFSAYPLGNAYSENSAVTLPNGNILFGSNYGLLLLNPANIKSRQYNYPIVFTNLLVNGITVNPDDKDSPLKQSLSFSGKIKLKHYQNSISVDFNSFDYADGDVVKYSYKLEHYDKDWSVPSSDKVATYKNLPSGKYVLMVRSSTGGGNWNPRVAKLGIVVSPPFYFTIWAFIFYFIFIGVTVLAIMRVVLNFNRLHNRIKVEKSLTEYKLVFFTNISHEFRTPLTLISGALDKIHSLQQILPAEFNYSVKILDKNIGRMIRLVDQLLEFRKMQNNKLALSLEEIDVIAFLNDIFQSFIDEADQKNMDYQFIPSETSYKMFVDKEKLDKIAYNLLSNAFKYTPSKGKIRMIVSINHDDNMMCMQVTDNGVGIPRDKQPELFSRFMQSTFSGNSVGIGLHLTHELVQVLKGLICYNENEGGGSVFTVNLPLDKSIYAPNDFLIANNVLLKDDDNRREKKQVEENFALPMQMAGKPLNETLVLVIEDNLDVLAFLKGEISSYFSVITASNGEEGLEKARSEEPALIVCDVMMPGIDGFQVVKELKNDFDTSHIPIILLTALESQESQLKGIESGADAYITKPFSTKLLLMRIFKLMESRNKLQKKFSQEPGLLQLPAIYSNVRDKEFADRLNTVLSDNLSDATFSVDDYAQKMGIGRTAFYKKVKGLTGSSPNEYIRIVRLKKAAEMLSDSNFTVSEVSYKVGIDDPFYFSKCFKAQFGVAPSMYRKGQPEKDKDNE